MSTNNQKKPKTDKQKAKFFGKQLYFLTNAGVPKKDALKIIKISGVAAIAPASKWIEPVAKQGLDQVTLMQAALVGMQDFTKDEEKAIRAISGRVTKDANLVLIFGLHGVKIGFSRKVQAMKDLGLEMPQIGDAKFGRVISATIAILNHFSPQPWVGRSVVPSKQAKPETKKGQHRKKVNKLEHHNDGQVSLGDVFADAFKKEAAKKAA